MQYDPPGARGERIPTTPSQRPGMVALADHLMATWGGSNLGIFSDRSIRGGSSTSLHAVSRAFDWGYTDRAAALRGADWLIENHEALGCQAIHDYADHHDGLGRTWGHGRGWHYGHIGSLGGHWLHVELVVETAADPNILDRIHQPEGESVYLQIARYRGNNYIVYSGGYKTWLPGSDALNAARFLAGHAGKDTSIHHYSEAQHGVWRAMGSILGARPSGTNNFGDPKD